MRITVDTNVLISATFWHGASETIINKVELNEIELILSQDTINEFVRVLDYREIRDKMSRNHLEMSRTVEKIVSISTIVEPKEKLDIVKDDPSDNKILECAKEGNVHYILSKDKHLLKLIQFGEIKIITPEDFLLLTKQ